jgi:hypothetical protein
LLEDKTSYLKRGISLFSALALSFGLVSCAPAFDGQSDKEVSDLQHLVDAKIVSLIAVDRRLMSIESRDSSSARTEVAKLKQEASFSANMGFYDDVDADLTSAQMRVDSSSDASKSNADSSFEALREILVSAPAPGTDPTSMQAVHEAQDRLGQAFLISTRSEVNTLFATLMRYEMTIKAGQSPAK